MDPYQKYLIYQARTQDMYRLLARRKSIYAQQGKKRTPDRTLVARSSKNPELSVYLPVDGYTTIREIRQAIASQVGGKFQDLELSRRLSSGREKLYDYPCVLDYNLSDGDEICFRDSFATT